MCDPSLVSMKHKHILEEYNWELSPHSHFFKYSILGQPPSPPLDLSSHTNSREGKHGGHFKDKHLIFILHTTWY